eukprot:11430214-Karenia_brevis.AAC.1
MFKFPKTRPRPKIWRPHELNLCEQRFAYVATNVVDSVVQDMHAIVNACTKAYPHVNSCTRKRIIPSQAS